MATRFFTHNQAPIVLLPSGDNSEVLPVGVDVGDFNENNAMNLLNILPASTVSLNHSSSATVSQQSAMMARHISPPLKAQTINAETWTINWIGAEGNNAANAFLAVSLYAYRPSTSSVVGYIRDSATTLGVEFNGGIQTNTFAGSSVNIQAGDVLVLEAWNVATQAMATSYNIVWAVGTIGGGTTYLETPQNLGFSKPKYQFFVTD